jgi:hypothetical protein
MKKRHSWKPAGNLIDGRTPLYKVIFSFLSYLCGILVIKIANSPRDEFLTD